MTVAGVDGCRAGWFVVYQRKPGGPFAWEVAPGFRDVLDGLPRGAVVGIDIPIGLPESGSRTCDRVARQRLGPRRASVFPAPLRPVLDARDYAEACARHERLDGRRMSRQAWNLVPKIREVDEVLRSFPASEKRIVEVHPELSFREMAGGVPMLCPKRSAGGRAERLATLEGAFGGTPALALAWSRGEGCLPDDVLDGFAALWTALRVRAGRARRVPGTTERDRLGLPMVIFA